MKIYIFGNGNISFNDFEHFYRKPLEPFLSDDDVEFIVCDFRGTDTLSMELLKCYTPRVTVYHIGEKPRYFPDTYKTKASQWQIKNGFKSDADRDFAAMTDCTHFLANDFNSDARRKSGTQQNIERCLELGKTDLSLI